MTKQTLALIALIVACAVPAARAAGDVPVSHDLRRDAAAARGINGVVLVVFVRDFCGYCERVLREFLIPMNGRMEYQKKVVMRRIESDSDERLLDFQGRETTHHAFSRAHGVRLTPTIQVFDTQGNPMGKPVIGLGPVDYYGDYLDQAIDGALEKIRALGRKH